MFNKLMLILPLYAGKMEDAKWNISKLDDLQCIVRDDFLALCDLLNKGPEMVHTYPMWTQFWIEMDRHEKGMAECFVNGSDWLQKTLKHDQLVQTAVKKPY